jgi:leucyl aminopeptidase (aminopeptidase T)
MILMQDVFDVKREEDILLITDDSHISDVIAQECKNLGAQFNLFKLLDQQRPVGRLSEVLASAIKSADVVLTPFKSFPDEAQFRMSIISTATKNVTCRLGHMPGVNHDVFENCILKTDYREIERLGLKLVQVLARARNCFLSSEGGTELELFLGGWQAKADAGVGDIKSYGSWENLPSGEVFKIPFGDNCKGRLVIDGAIPGKVFDQDKNERIVFTVKHGKIVRIQDLGSSQFKKRLAEIDSKRPELNGNIYKIAELGIGTNSAARVTPYAIEFEKKLGTVHVAIGENRFFGGNIAALDHIDMMVLRPTLVINGVELIRDGKISETAMEDILNEDYSDYEADLKTKPTLDTRIYPSRDIGSCETTGNAIYRAWKSPTGRIFRTKMGNEKTSRLACEAWGIIRHELLDVNSLARRLKVEPEVCLRLVEMMADFQVIDLAGE